MTTSAATGRATLVRTIAEQHRDQRGPLLPVLHDLVEELGHLERDDLRVVAEVLNLSLAEVHGVVSFYHDFRTTPRATHTVTLCRAEACQSVGAATLYEQTRADASTLGEDVAVEEVFCLGNCALGPAGVIDGTLHGRLSRERILDLTREWRA